MNPNSPWEHDPGQDDDGPRRPNWTRLLVVAAGAFVLIYLASKFAPRDFSAHEGADLVRLVMLLAVIGTGVLLWNRMDNIQFAKTGLIWAGIFAVAIFIGAIWEDMGFGSGRLAGRLAPGTAVEDGGAYWIQPAMDGHFYVLAEISGARLRLMVDTGASEVALSRSDAARIGIDLDALKYTDQVSTANGLATAAPIRIDEIAVGGIVVRDVRAHVADDGMDGSLLGMSFLAALSAYGVEDGEFYMRP